MRCITLSFFCVYLFASSLAAEETSIKGLIFVDAEENIPSVERGKEEVVTFNLSIPEKTEFREKLSSSFINKELTIERLQEIKLAVLQHYQDNDRPFTAVYIPEQDVTDGNIVLVVTESKLGEYKYKGNRWYQNEQLGRYFDIQSGQQLSRETLLNDVSWLNRNPFHYSEIRAIEGDEVGTTNIELVTREYYPVRVYVGSDNTGNGYIGNNHIYTGINWGNFLGKGNVVTYQYTMNPNSHRYHSHYGNFTSFLNIKHILMLSGGYNKTDPNFDNFLSDGKYIQASFRYTIPIKPLYTPFLQEFTFGFDYKNINSNLFFISTGDAPVIANQVNISEIVVAYAFSNVSKHLDLEMNVEGFLSPGQIFPHQSNKVYQDLRPNAKNPFAYGRFTFSYTAKFPWNFSFAGVLRGQVASNTLLPSEEFGLGGHNTVRGYQERQFNADTAFCASTELRSPPTRLIPRIKDNLVFLLFCDYGIGHNYHVVEGDNATQSLCGVGGGLRYAAGRYINARVDYGWELKKIQPNSNHKRKLYFGVVASY